MAYVILDSSFINRIRRVDEKCGIISLFADPYKASCIYHAPQFKENPCYKSNPKPDCMNLESLFNDEDVVEFSMNNGKNLAKISRDIVDIQILFFASRENNVTILTCDSNLLEACRRFSIGHFCFKAALRHLDVCYGGEIFNGQDYITDPMHDPKGEDPFFYYGRNTRCTLCYSEINCMSEEVIRNLKCLEN